MSELQRSPDSELSNIATNVRHFMWNDDYLELLAHKLDLQKVRSLVDLGSGLGYLSGQLALYMRAGGVVYSYDLDAEALAVARARVEANPFSVRFEFAEADALALPLPDDAVDMAMCQHLLMHLNEPEKAIAEMLRVVRPGGRVVAFEPNNMIQALVSDSLSEHYSLEQRLNLVRYQHYYEAGKRLLGHGDDSIGDRLPRLFHEAGLTHIEVRLSDKGAALVPPYDTEEKRVRARELLSWLSTYEANSDFLRRCFLAGGGSESEWEAFIAWELEQSARISEQIRAEKFVYPGGLLTYIVIGQKPLSA